MNIFRQAACIAATCVAMTAAAQATDVAALSKLSGADREARLLEGARKEGQVVVYGSLVGKDVGPLAAAFERKYGVKVSYWRAGSEKVLQRAVTEGRAGRSIWCGTLPVWQRGDQSLRNESLPSVDHPSKGTCGARKTSHGHRTC